MILLPHQLHLHSRLFFCLTFSVMLFLCEHSNAQQDSIQKKRLFVFPVATTTCKPQSKSDSLQIRIKIKQMGIGIPSLRLDDSLLFNDSKSTALANEALHYNEAGQLVNIAITMVNLKNTATEMATSPFSGLPEGIKNDMLGNIKDVIDSMTLQKEMHFEFTYNDSGQLVQIIMPKFSVSSVNGTLNLNDADTTTLKYDSFGRITNIREYVTTSAELERTTKKGHSYKTINVHYLSATSIRCTSVSTDGPGTVPEKTITDFNFNSKGNLIKATRKKTDSSGTLQLVNETVYSYYEDIKNPEYYALNKNFALAFISDNTSFYADISVNCLKKAVIHNADGSTETITTGNFSFDANRNIVRYEQENESKEASNKFFNNYTYNKSCSTKPGTSAPKEDAVKTTLPQVKDIKGIDGKVYHAIKIGNQTWMAEDLRVTQFRNGDAIPEVADASLWKYLQKSAYNRNNAQGYLYNWHAINDARNIAPVGWHVATDAEWNTLIKNLGGASVAGGALKDVSAWTDNQVNTNESGFSALPMGKINSDSGLYEWLDKAAYYWIKSLLSANGTTASSFNIKSSNNLIQKQQSKKTDGLSVRCVKD